MKRALAEQSAQSVSCHEMIKVVLMDCLTELTHSSLVENVPTFNGTSLVFADLPKVSTTKLASGWLSDNMFERVIGLTACIPLVK